MPAILKKDGTAEVTCECGKPLVEVNAHGMFCEDFCGLPESIKVCEQIIDETIEQLNQIFDDVGLNERTNNGS